MIKSKCITGGTIYQLTIKHQIGMVVSTSLIKFPKNSNLQMCNVPTKTKATRCFFLVVGSTRLESRRPVCSSSEVVDLQSLVLYCHFQRFNQFSCYNFSATSFFSLLLVSNVWFVKHLKSVIITCLPKKKTLDVYIRNVNFENDLVHNFVECQ